ncbi:MAG: agmatine/peptidylarginine deiminase [Opitutales bacterium]
MKPETILEPRRLPAEWEPQQALWLSWPLSSWLWPGRLPEAQALFARLAVTAACYQPVCINAAPEAHTGIRQALDAAGSAQQPITLLPVPTDDVWIRDHGPIFVRDGKERLLATDWTFNAWGGKFPEYARDNAVPAVLAEACQWARAVPEPGYILEGGAIESDGRGTVLTTEPVILNPNRNPNFSPEEHHAILKRGLGVERVISLPEGIPNDDTDGHIDNVARFTPRGDVLLALHPSLPQLERNRERLTAEGFTVEALVLPQLPGNPPPPASYANYVVLNAAVLVPTFDTAAEDARAIATLQAAFPEREIVPFDARLLLAEGGALHCCTLNAFA